MQSLLRSVRNRMLRLVRGVADRMLHLVRGVADLVPYLVSGVADLVPYLVRGVTNTIEYAATSDVSRALDMGFQDCSVPLDSPFFVAFATGGACSSPSSKIGAPVRLQHWGRGGLWESNASCCPVLYVPIPIRIAIGTPDGPQRNVRE